MPSPSLLFLEKESILGNPCTRQRSPTQWLGMQCDQRHFQQALGHNGYAWVDLLDGLDKPTATFPSFVSIPSSRLVLLPTLMPRLAIAGNKELLLTPTPASFTLMILLHYNGFKKPPTVQQILWTRGITEHKQPINKRQ